MPIWIPVTIAAAFLQNLRSALQKKLKSRMGTTGATFARFGFGFPFVALFLLVMPKLTGEPVPPPNAWFLLAVTICGATQIAATFLLVWLFSFRNFMIGTAYSKTEPVQAALFGLVILGETVSPFGLAAIVVGVLGVVVISVAGAGEGISLRRAIFSRPALIGILSGAMFGMAAVGARWASLSLDEGGAFTRAVTALAYVTGFQTAIMLAYMAVFDRPELRRIAAGWKPSLAVGLAGIAASTGWFTAMTLEKVAYVRALGQIELLFTFASSVMVFRERIRPLELVGCAMILAAILGILGVVT